VHPPPPPAADRIAATLQLLTFFFISVFAFNPRNFCEDAVKNGFNDRCPENQGAWAHMPGWVWRWIACMHVPAQPVRQAACIL